MNCCMGLLSQEKEILSKTVSKISLRNLKITMMMMMMIMVTEVKKKVQITTPISPT